MQSPPSSPALAGISDNRLPGPMAGESSEAGIFPQTRWTQVARIVSDEPAAAFGALSDWSTRYWTPLFSYARHWGKTEEAAQDSTQSFFLALIERNYLKTADPARGRLRTFLLSLFKHHLAHEARDASRLKRGGAAVHLSLDDPKTGPLPDAALADTQTPDEIFHQRWALGLLQSTLDRVQHEWTRRGKGAAFTELVPHLLGEAPTDLNGSARRLGTCPSTVRSWLHRLRLAFHAALWEAVAATLEDESPKSIQAELDELRRYFAGRPHQA